MSLPIFSSITPLDSSPTSFGHRTGNPHLSLVDRGNTQAVLRPAPLGREVGWSHGARLTTWRHSLWIEEEGEEEGAPSWSARPSSEPFFASAHCTGEPESVGTEDI